MVQNVFIRLTHVNADSSDAFNSYVYLSEIATNCILYNYLLKQLITFQIFYTEVQEEVTMLRDNLLCLDMVSNNDLNRRSFRYTMLYCFLTDNKI